MRVLREGFAMLLIAVLLGAAFAWAVQLLWTQYRAYRGAAHEQALANLRRDVLN